MIHLGFCTGDEWIFKKRGMGGIASEFTVIIRIFGHLKAKRNTPVTKCQFFPKTLMVFYESRVNARF